MRSERIFFSCILLISHQFLEVLTIGQFFSTVIEGKSVYLFGRFRLVKELKNILVLYGEKSSGPKGILVQQDSWTYQLLFNKFCLNLQRKSDLRETLPLTFIQLYEYLVILHSHQAHFDFDIFVMDFITMFP